jgi:hypothetical protein
VSIEEHLAGLGHDAAAEHLDERRLARAVLADERMDLARVELEIDGRERTHAGERFREGGDAEKRRGGRRAHRERAFASCHAITI